MIGYDTEYTKREMSLFTRVVLLLLIFVMVLFLALFVGHFKFGLNANMINEFCKIDENGEELLKNAFQKLKLSVRAYQRILKVARTIADLESIILLFLSIL